MTLRKISFTVALGVAIALAVPVLAQAPAEPAAAAAGKPATSTHPAQAIFATPEAGAEGLAAAIRTGDGQKVLNVVGPNSSSWIFSGDKVADCADWKKFLSCMTLKHHRAEP